MSLGSIDHANDLEDEEIRTCEGLVAGNEAVPAEQGYRFGRFYFGEKA